MGKVWARLSGRWRASRFDLRSSFLDCVVGFPKQDRPGRVLAVEGVDQAGNLGRLPDVVALDLRQAQLPTVDAVHQARDLDRRSLELSISAQSSDPPAEDYDFDAAGCQSVVPLDLSGADAHRFGFHARASAAIEARNVLSIVDLGAATPERFNGGLQATIARASRSASGAVSSHVQVAIVSVRDIQSVSFESSVGARP